MAVELVLTERRSDLSEARAANYERLRERLKSTSRESVRDSHYEEVEPDRLARASSIVLSGSSAPWSVREPEKIKSIDAEFLSGRRFPYQEDIALVEDVDLDAATPRRI